MAVGNDDETRLPPSVPLPGGDAGEFDASRSLTRLAVGGALIGAERLLRSLAMWEDVAAETPSLEDGDTSSGARMRHAAIGALFEAERIALAGGAAVIGATARTWRATERGLASIPLPDPARAASRRVREAWSTRWRSTVDRVLEVGRTEEAKARRLVDVAVRDTTDVGFGQATGRAVEELAASPQVKELIRAQTVTVTADIVQEVRQRTSLVDDLLERRVRALFKRTPRAPGPVPVPEVIPGTTVEPT